MEKRGRVYTAGTGTGNWCSGAIVLCSLACVVGVLVAVAPRGCCSHVLVYMGQKTSMLYATQRYITP